MSTPQRYPRPELQRRSPRLAGLLGWTWVVFGFQKVNRIKSFAIVPCILYWVKSYVRDKSMAVDASVPSHLSVSKHRRMEEVWSRRVTHENGRRSGIAVDVIAGKLRAYAVEVSFVTIGNCLGWWENKRRDVL